MAFVRVQELCESGGGRPYPPVPNSPYGLCGRKAIVFLSLGRLDNVTRCMPGGRYRSRLTRVSVVVPLVRATWKDRRYFRLCLRLPSVGDSKRTCLLHTLLDF